MAETLVNSKYNSLADDCFSETLVNSEFCSFACVGVSETLVNSEFCKLIFSFVTFFAPKTEKQDLVEKQETKKMAETLVNSEFCSFADIYTCKTEKQELEVTK
ncbi:MAG: hypothetical protein N2738_06245 [Thermodesulfovibrionales bacterium]|nr:hypothetical protein [Thermodesulfovibrionales bacterium]